ncbi:hypothetical protein FRC04_003980 [Tulasnella sp. 424]|nr:hypothetical protein FRC04_003980 [Tulasnella sp. 424]KAG8965420.1 hypothetical protein FRC05_003257 [Tulasnella sp. 425]
MFIQLTGEAPGSSDPSDPVDSDNCRLLGPVALVVQAVMGIVVVLSLVYKRHREHPPRPWRIWLFDVSKQVAGQAIVHSLNIGISALVSRPSTGNNPCTAYFVNVTFDVTVGVGIIWAVLHGSQNLLTKRLGLHGFESGQYGTPPSFNYWIRQASVYVLAVIVMKLAVLALLALVPSLLDVGEWLLSWTDGRTSVQIVFVMGIYPIIMNVLQFWLIDSIVKASAFLDSREAERAVASTADYEPLPRDSGDGSESEEEAQPSRPRDLETPSKAGSTSRSTSRQASTVSGSSVPKSIHSTRPRSLSKSRQPGASVQVASSIHDYPPSQQASPLPSPKSASFRSLRKRSPPPSPSPAVTPSGDYGATGDSPRLKQTEPDSVPSGWEWEEDKDARRSRSPKITGPRRESWDLPAVQSPTRPVA